MAFFLDVSESGNFVVTPEQLDVNAGHCSLPPEVNLMHIPSCDENIHFHFKYCFMSILSQVEEGNVEYKVSFLRNFIKTANNVAVYMKALLVLSQNLFYVYSI